MGASQNVFSANKYIQKRKFCLKTNNGAFDNSFKIKDEIPTKGHKNNSIPWKLTNHRIKMFAHIDHRGEKRRKKRSHMHVNDGEQQQQPGMLTENDLIKKSK